MSEVGEVPCPNCGQRTEAYAAACPRCGMPRDLAVYDDAGTFLGTTFAPVRQATPTPVAPPSAPQATPTTMPLSGAYPPNADEVRRRKHRRALLLVLGGVVVIVLGVAAGLIFTQQTRQPEEAVPAPATTAPAPETSATTQPTPPQPSATQQTPTQPTPTQSAAPTERPTPSSAPSTTEVASPAPEPEPEPEPTRTASRPGPPIRGTDTYQHPNGGSCAAPAGWEGSELSTGQLWSNGDAEVSCEGFGDDLASIKSMVEDSWGGQGWDVTFSDGDATQYRASGYSPQGDIFWLGGKRRSGGDTSMVTLWIYPQRDKGYYDSHVETAWTQLTPP